MKVNDDKFALFGGFNKEWAEMLEDKITKIAINRISPDGRLSIWFSELCDIIGLPQPVVDHTIYFDIDPRLFLAIMLDFERRNEASIELESTRSFNVTTKEGALYSMEHEDDDTWSITIFKSEGQIKISRDFLNEIETLCKLVENA